MQRIMQRLRQVFVQEQPTLTPQVSDAMADAITLWDQLYRGTPPWADDEEVTVTNLPSAIASELARLVTLELRSDVRGSARAEYLRPVYQRFLQNLRPQVEYACAKGGVVWKPYLQPDGSLGIDCIHADCFFPTAFDADGKLIGAVFSEQVLENDQYYTRLESHERTEQGYEITQRAFQSRTRDNLGKEVPLASVSAWKKLSRHTILRGVAQPLFVYFKMPLANHLDPSSPLGVSVYARATGLLEQADRQYSRILWEFEGSELAIDADISLFRKNADGTLSLPKGRERLFRAMDLDEDNSKYNVFSPAIRDESLFRGLDRLLRQIEFSCGLAYGTLSQMTEVDRTAEEIRASKQRSYATVCDIQQSLARAIRELLGALDVFCTLYRLCPAGVLETEFEFDDSIVADRHREFEEKKAMVDAGLMEPEEFRAWYFGA